MIHYSVENCLLFRGKWFIILWKMIHYCSDMVHHSLENGSLFHREMVHCSRKMDHYSGPFKDDHHTKMVYWHPDVFTTFSTTFLRCFYCLEKTHPCPRLRLPPAAEWGADDFIPGICTWICFTVVGTVRPVLQVQTMQPMVHPIQPIRDS